MPQRLLTKTGRYSRRVLYGCTAALSIAIVGAVLLLGRGIIDQYGDRQVARFVRTSGEVRTEVDGLSARLAQFADLYEGSGICARTTWCQHGAMPASLPPTGARP